MTAPFSKVVENIITDVSWKRAIALRDLGECNEYDDQVEAMKSEAKAAIIASHEADLREAELKLLDRLVEKLPSVQGVPQD